MTLARALPVLALGLGLLAAPVARAGSVAPFSEAFLAHEKPLRESMDRLAKLLLDLENLSEKSSVEALSKAAKELDEGIQNSLARGVGPLSDPGNLARERRVSLAILQVLARYCLSETEKVSSTLASLPEPQTSYEARNIAGIPMVLRGNAKAKTVSLTFDDGPDAKHTPEVLDVLAKHQVRGTFFVVGKAVLKNPEVLRRIHAEGHEIAHHSFSHPRMTELDDARIAKEVQRTDESLSQVLPDLPPSRMFRLPYQIGHKSKRVQTALAKRFDYLVDWTVDSKDYLSRSPEFILQNVWPQSKKNGAIILFHDRRPHTAAAVDVLITRLKGEGYGFGTVSEVMGTDLPGRRLRSLRAALEDLAADRPNDAGRKLGNFGFHHRKSPGASIALFSSYLLSRWLKKTKSEKLKSALLEIHPGSMFAKVLAEDAPSSGGDAISPRGDLPGEKPLLLAKAPSEPKLPSPEVRLPLAPTMILEASLEDPSQASLSSTSKETSREPEPLAPRLIELPAEPKPASTKVGPRPSEASTRTLELVRKIAMRKTSKPVPELDSTALRILKLAQARRDGRAIATVPQKLAQPLDDPDAKTHDGTHFLGVEPEWTPQGE